MQWFDPNDDSSGVITAEGHVRSRHSEMPEAPKLPDICILFEIGMSIDYIETHYETSILIDRLPAFLENPKCIAVKGLSNCSFIRGGYGAPAAVDTLETLLALGVKTVLVAGMCGGFSPELQVGDVVIPRKILSEEGTSRHYTNEAYAYPAPAFHARAAEYYSANFRVFNHPTVTTDAVYRQTFSKESYWRDLGCVGVDMESSALLAVSTSKSVQAASVLLVSDVHPQSPGEGGWDWGNTDFNRIKESFIEQTISFCSSFSPDILG